MAENKYNIMMREVHASDIDDNVFNLYVHEFNDMTANEVSQWLLQMIAECKFVLHVGNHPDPNVTEEEITAQFNELAEAINALAEAHETKSATFKVLGAYVTVQVIYPKEEST